VRFSPRVDKTCQWQVNPCDPSLRRATPDSFRDELLIIKRFTFLHVSLIDISYLMSLPFLYDSLSFRKSSSIYRDEGNYTTEPCDKLLTDF